MNAKTFKKMMERISLSMFLSLLLLWITLGIVIDPNYLWIAGLWPMLGLSITWAISCLTEYLGDKIYKQEWYELTKDEKYFIFGDHLGG